MTTAEHRLEGDLIYRDTYPKARLRIEKKPWNVGAPNMIQSQFGDWIVVEAAFDRQDDIYAYEAIKLQAKRFYDDTLIAEKLRNNEPSWKPYALTTTQAAAILGVIPRRVQALIRAGKITASKHGRDWLVDAESVEAYRLTRKNGAPSKERK